MNVEGKLVSSFCALDKEVCGTSQKVKKYLGKMDIVIRKRQSRPIEERLKMLVEIILHEETYSSLGGKNWRGTGYFWSPAKKLSVDVKYNSHTEFHKRGAFLSVRLAVKGKMYRTKCLP